MSETLQATLTQDIPPEGSHEREERAEKDKPQYSDFTAVELSNLAQKEWHEQDVLRGPVIVPEWNDAAFWCKRLNYLQMKELREIYAKNGDIGIFCFRALNSTGQRIFTSIPMFSEEMQAAWNPAIIERITLEFASLSRTQLTDAELGKS